MTTLEDALAEYLRLVESGAALDRDEFLRRYELHRDELAEFIDNHRHAVGMAAALSLSGDRSAISTHLAHCVRTGKIGDYELGELIGRGGMGVVYRARQTKLDRDVALKMISCEHQDPQRFRHEAEAVAALEHPHIVSIYDIGADDGMMYYSMPLFTGGDLRQRLEQGSLAPEAAARIAVKLAGAVEYAHQRGVLHRDLKPGNVLFDEHGEPVITDFGLAKSIHDDTQRTRTGAVLGTPSYMAPEQASGELGLATTAIDVYGLGAVLYAMLTGRAPFEGTSSLQVIRKVEREPPLSPRAVDPTIPRDITVICLKCLEKRPADRYASARELQLDLQRFIDHRPVAARPISLAERAIRWYANNLLLGNLGLLLIAVLIVSSLGGTALAWREYRSRQQAEQAGSMERQAKQLAFTSLIDLYTSQGRQAQLLNRQAEAALWFAQAAEVAAGTASWSNAVVRLERRQRYVPQPMRAATVGSGSVRWVSFHPSGRYLLLCDHAGAIWFWDLQLSADPEPLSILADAHRAVWSPDGRWLVAANEHGQIALVNLVLQSCTVVAAQQAAITALAINPQGNTLAYAAGDRVELIPLSRVEQQNMQPRAEASETGLQEIVHLEFSRKGDRLLAAGNNDLACLFDSSSNPATLPVVGSPFGYHTQNPTKESAPMLPVFINDQQLAVVFNRRVEYRQIQDGSVNKSAAIGDAASIDFEPVGNAAVVGGPNQGRMILTRNNQSFRQFNHQELVASVDYHRRLPFVATGSWDRRAVIWEVQYGRAIGDLQHQNRVSLVRFSPLEDLICTVQIDGLVRIWRWQPEQSRRRTIVNPTGWVRAKTSAARTEWFLAGAAAGKGGPSTLQLFSFANLRRRFSKTQLPGQLCDSDLSADGATWLAAIEMPTSNPESPPDAARYQLHLIDQESGGERHPPISLPSRPACVTSQPAGNLTVVACHSGQLLVVDHELGAVLQTLDVHANESTAGCGPFTRVEFSPAGDRLICFGPDQTLSLFQHQQTSETQTWEACSLPESLRAATFAEFSPGGEHLVLVLPEGAVAVWDLVQEQIAGPILPHSEPVYRAHFSPDGTRIATSCADNLARVFDWKSGRLICLTPTQRSDMSDAVFSPDGQWLLTASSNALVSIWSADNGRFIDQVTISNSSAADLPGIPAAEIQLSASGNEWTVSGARGRVDEVVLEPPTRLAPADASRTRVACELAAGSRIEQGGVSPLPKAEWIALWRQYRQVHSDLLQLDFPQALEIDWARITQSTNAGR